MIHVHVTAGAPLGPCHMPQSGTYQHQCTQMYRCHHYRSISGILALRKKYDDEIIDRACRRACHYESITYRTVKKICDSGLHVLPLEETAGNRAGGTGKIRNLADYRDMTGLGVIGDE